jgi:hypothetical protein
MRNLCHCSRFKLDQQAKFIDRVQNVEVREAKVKGTRASAYFVFLCCCFLNEMY